MSDAAVDDSNAAQGTRWLPKGAVLRLGHDRYRSGVSHLRFRPDSRTLVVAARSSSAFFGPKLDGTRPVALIKARTGEVIRRLGPATTDDFKWTVIAISGDGCRVALRKTLIQRNSFLTTGTPFRGRSDVEILDVGSGEILSTLPAASHPRAALNYNGSRLLVCPSHQVREDRTAEL